MINLVKIYPVRWGQDLAIVQDVLKKQGVWIEAVKLQPIIAGNDLWTFFAWHPQGEAHLHKLLRQCVSASREVEFDTAYNPQFVDYYEPLNRLRQRIEAELCKGAGI